MAFFLALQPRFEPTAVLDYMFKGQLYYFFFDQIPVLGTYANIADPVQMPQNVASYQGIHCLLTGISMENWGWSGGTKVLGKLPVRGGGGVLLIWIIVEQGPIALAVGAGGGCLDIFSLIYHFSFLSFSLWETARYRLKYCLKGPLSPKQPTNQLCRTLFGIERFPPTGINHQAV